MAPPRYTILMPTHNRADVIGCAIESALRQTDGDFELLVVGDGCTDHTAQVVAGFNDPRIRWLDLPKAPHYGYANRNIALKQAQGHYITFCAHDDILFSDHLALLSAEMERTGAVWAYSRPIWVSGDGVMAPLSGDLREPDLMAEYQVQNFIPASNVMHLRACFDWAGYWPEDAPNSGDWILWKRIIDGAGGKIAYVPTPTMLHFKANWKSRRDSHMDQLNTLLAVADEAEWWPEILRLNIQDGRTEQAVAAAQMQANAPLYEQQIRTACAQVLERLNTETIRYLLPMLREILQEMPQEQQIAAQEIPANAPLQSIGRRLTEVYGYISHQLQCTEALRAEWILNEHQIAQMDDITLIRNSYFFDGEYYLQHNPDVAAAGVDPATHFHTHGWKERRRPSRYFDTNFYLNIQPELLEANINPLVHHLRKTKDPFALVPRTGKVETALRLRQNSQQSLSNPATLWRIVLRPFYRNSSAGS